MTSPDRAGREATSRPTPESIGDNERQNGRWKWHCERLLRRTLASDALEDTTTLDLLPGHSGEGVFPRPLLVWRCTARQLPLGTRRSAC